MGAPKYRAPQDSSTQKAPAASKEDITKLKNKINNELKKPEQIKKLSLLIAELLK